LNPPLFSVPDERNNQNDLAVHVRNVIKSFGTGEAKTLALKGVNFDARQGEVLMIVGPSGCGKTTLLSVIAGTLQFDSGEVDVFGHQLHQMKKSEVTQFRKSNIGFIFQQFNLIPTLNCLENITIPLLINGVSRAECEERGRRLLEEVGLKGKELDRPGKLSGGQQQRVAIGRALIHNPRLLICDEPTSALDKETGLKIMELLRNVAKAPDRAVIVVTHDPRIYRFADRMTEMEDGTVQRVHDAPGSVDFDHHH
jgi:putative ABC transport system ATP-binding protein